MRAVKIPIERVEGTGVRAFLLFRIETAGDAVVAHLFLIGSPRGVGLGGEPPAVSKEDHPQHIGHHDPVIGIQIHLGVPTKDGLRFITTQEEIVAENHESLDVVIVGSANGSMNGFGDTTHFGFSVVGPSRERSLGIQEVDLPVGRHFEPVDAVDELPPTENLADEALD